MRHATASSIISSHTHCATYTLACGVHPFKVIAAASAQSCTYTADDDGTSDGCPCNGVSTSSTNKVSFVQLTNVLMFLHSHDGHPPCRPVRGPRSYPALTHTSHDMLPCSTTLRRVETTATARLAAGMSPHPPPQSAPHRQISRAHNVCMHRTSLDCRTHPHIMCL
jgi:hypothetical protein